MNEIESMRYFQALYDRFADKPGEVYWARVHSQTTREAIETALTALREKAEREKGCEYCNSRFGIATHHITESGMKAGTNKTAIFCPMCGKELEVGKCKT